MYRHHKCVKYSGLGRKIQRGERERDSQEFAKLIPITNTEVNNYVKLPADMTRRIECVYVHFSSDTKSVKRSKCMLVTWKAALITDHTHNYKHHWMHVQKLQLFPSSMGNNGNLPSFPLLPTANHPFIVTLKCYTLLLITVQMSPFDEYMNDHKEKNLEMVYTASHYSSDVSIWWIHEWL